MRKNVFITGASSGIGKVLGEYLTDNGFNVIGTSRQIDAQNPKFEIIHLDVTEDESVRKAFQTAINKYSTIDVLINNAGYGVCGPLENTSINEAKSQFETNYFGVVRMTNAFLPHFKANNNGLILNISSMGGLIGLPFQGHYSASKFALEGYIEALRMELHPYPIYACNINPADFKTPFTSNRKFAVSVSVEYKDKFEQFLKMYEHDEANGSDPLIIAKLVNQLIMKKNGFSVRYIVGKSSQTIAATIKRMLGGNLFEKVLMNAWKV